MTDEGCYHDRVVARFEGQYARPAYAEAAELLEDWLGVPREPAAPGVYFRIPRSAPLEEVVRALNNAHRDELQRLDVTAAASGSAIWLLPSRDANLIVEYWVTGAYRHGSDPYLPSKIIAQGLSRVALVALVEIETIHDDYFDGRALLREGYGHSDLKAAWNELRQIVEPGGDYLADDGTFFLDWKD